jgi:16S rRNA (cytidine1402-2'-O)-methyltransferase
MVELLSKETRAVVLLEAPHRMEELAKALAPLTTRLITIGRELTKQFETVATMQCDALCAWLAADDNRLRGEFALVIHPAPQVAHSGPDQRVLALLLPHLPLKSAVKLASDITGQPRNALYELALSMKSGAAPGAAGS